MVLMRDPLGRLGSFGASGLNVLQNVGWATFELIVISTAAGALGERLFGVGARWVWVIVFALVTTALALAGPIRFVQRYVRPFAVWVVLASLAYLTWWTLRSADLGMLWSRPGSGGLSFAQGVDLTVAMSASWLPLAADYTRFARGRRDALFGTALGYFVPNVWLYALGALLLLTHGLSDPAAILPAIAAGGGGGALALLALTVDETDEPFANVYSAAISLQNVFPRASQRLLVVAVAAVATAGALALDLVQYGTFLYLLGSCFVPLFGVLAADFLLGEAPPVAVRVSGLVAWAAGFAVYQWIQPTGPGWWSNLLAAVPDSGVLATGASLPSFAVAFVLYAAFRRPLAARLALAPPGR
jgi:putative hydroxymethylpyrimidine transporter CytX